jgi:hypothetical protein
MASASTADRAAELNDNDVAALDRLRTVYERLKRELSRVIIGQEETVERLTICLFARGHALLMGVPGLAKTLLVSKLAETVSLKFSRIQFTPDLMPMDITGTDILQETADGRREFHFVPGPVFANIVLADEINRAPPKTQAARAAVLRAGHAESRRAGRHLSPARGPARPLHVPHRARLSDRRGRGDDRPKHDRQLDPRARARAHGR